MDPITIGAIAAAGSSTMNNGTSLLNNFGNFLANKHLQEDTQDFNSSEALKQRTFEAKQAELARDWQTNANQIAMDFNHQEAELARAWQERMSSTEVQRRMKDMERAGINPILASQYGANTPNGQSASVGTSNTSTARGSSASSNSNSVRFTSNVFNGILDTLNSAKKISNFFEDMHHESHIKNLSTDGYWDPSKILRAYKNGDLSKDDYNKYFALSGKKVRYKKY